MLYNYDEFNNMNEGFFGKVLRSLKDFAAEPLNDFLRDIEKSGDPKKIINSLREYATLNNSKIDKALNTIKNKEELTSYLEQTLVGLYTAIKGVQATRKVNKTYFDEMFKDADKNLVKVMNYDEKKFYPAIKNYVEEYLLPNLEKISGKNESFKPLYFDEVSQVFEEIEFPKPASEESIKKLTGKSKEEDNIDKETEKEIDNKEKENGVSDELKSNVKKWLNTVFYPILRTKPPKENRKENNYIRTKGDSVIKRGVAQDILRNAQIDDIKDFRDKVAKKANIDPKKWRVGR